MRNRAMKGDIGARGNTQTAGTVGFFKHSLEILDSRACTVLVTLPKLFSSLLELSPCYDTQI